MDYKDYLAQSKRRLDSTLDSLRKKNSEVLGSFGLSKDESSNSDANCGVILTDTAQLASEYGCKRSILRDLIQGYVLKREKAGFSWYILDLADIEENYLLPWKEIISILAKFKVENGLNTNGCPIPLFIIGNDSVVPMPRMENPTPQVIGGEYIDADYRYAFESDGDETDYSPFVTQLSFYVGRFPAPIVNALGPEELSTYLENCARIEEEGGIVVGNASMISTESWIPSSKDMVSDIPVSKVDSDSILSVEGKLILSPNLDLEENETYRVFSKIERTADYMVFNLHGSDAPEAASYYGEDINHTYYPEGFRIDLLQRNAPQIVIATACFGARFIDYTCSNSMLLSAIANGTLLFVGSCVTALGNPEGAGFSEYLVKLLNVYLHQGLPAGEAFSKAKEVYYQTKVEEEGSEYTLFTNLEFNLFGNPMLFMRPKLPVDYVPKGAKDTLDRSAIPVFKADEYRIICNKNNEERGDILSQVRFEVDRGLDKIAQMIQEELYDRLGLQGAELESIIEYGTPGKDRGYYYTFRKSCGRFDAKTIAKTDLRGSIVNIIETK